MKILKIFWAFLFIFMISLNHKKYFWGDWITLIVLYSIPYIIDFFKNKKKEKINNIKTTSDEKESSIPNNINIVDKKENKENISVKKNKSNEVENIIKDDKVKELIKRDYLNKVNQINKTIKSNNSLYPEYTEKYKLLPEEKRFLDVFWGQLIKNKIDLRISTERRSNGEIFVEYRGCQVGRINLQNNNHSMQILRGMHGNKVIEGNIDDFIEQIPAWIRYIKYLKRN